MAYRSFQRTYCKIRQLWVILWINFVNQENLTLQTSSQTEMLNVTKIWVNETQPWLATKGGSKGAESVNNREAIPKCSGSGELPSLHSTKAGCVRKLQRFHTSSTDHLSIRAHQPIQPIKTEATASPPAICVFFAF